MALACKGLQKGKMGAEGLRWLRKSCLLPLKGFRAITFKTVIGVNMRRIMSVQGTPTK